MSDEELTPAMDNVIAMRLGEIARECGGSRSDVGDEIDRGLILARRLREEGFRLSMVRGTQDRDALVRREAVEAFYAAVMARACSPEHEARYSDLNDWEQVAWALEAEIAKWREGQ